MTFEDPAFYGDIWASVYDKVVGSPDPAQAVEFLADLVGDGKVLELAIGTGRVALPLAEQGVHIEGLDASRAMVDVLRTKPGGAQIPVVIGDMAEVPVQGPFRLVYLVYSTLFFLLSQGRQADCFRNVAQVLEPGGAFVIETIVPDLTEYGRGQHVQAVGVTENVARFQVARHDPVAQRVDIQTVTLGPQGFDLKPMAIRYAWPPELDLMARLAGLTLAERYEDWNRRPFGPASLKHVSVYQK
jgi:SAM-dependent methyltransferase